MSLTLYIDIIHVGMLMIIIDLYMSYCIAGNIGKVFNLVNWGFYRRSPNFKSAIFYSDKIWRYYVYNIIYVLGFVMSPNLKLAKSFWGLIHQVYNARQSFPLYGRSSRPRALSQWISLLACPPVYRCVS